jgi:hypothetical protein
MMSAVVGGCVPMRPLSPACRRTGPLRNPQQRQTRRSTTRQRSSRRGFVDPAHAAPWECPCPVASRIRRRGSKDRELRSCSMTCLQRSRSRLQWFAGATQSGVSAQEFLGTTNLRREAHNKQVAAGSRENCHRLQRLTGAVLPRMVSGIGRMRVVVSGVFVRDHYGRSCSGLPARNSLAWRTGALRDVPRLSRACFPGYRATTLPRWPFCEQASSPDLARRDPVQKPGFIEQAAWRWF